MYMATIRGPGKLPVYLPVWEPESRAFALGYWDGTEAVTILPTSEAPGLEALGFEIDWGIGMVTQETFTLRPFVDQLQELIADNPRDSAEVAIAKAFGVSVYGKFAETPEHNDVAYSVDSPGEGWLPFLDERGFEVDNLWTARKVSYRAHQHVDVAATITAAVRSRLYSALSAVMTDGGTVVHADTDGFIGTKDLTTVALDAGDSIGQWRVDSAPEATAIAGKKAYSFGAAARVAGVHGATPAMVEFAVYGETVVVAGKKLVPPWAEGPMFQPLSRRFGATA